jgi:hypothetical protein
MDKNLIKIRKGSIEQLIFLVRGQKIMLDRDLAAIYGVPTFRFNEAVRRNMKRFPEDFMFQLTRQEVEILISQNAMSKPGRGGRRTLPYAFIEHRAIMAANILNSPRAVQMSVFVVRAFVRMRSMMSDTRELARHLSMPEKELKERLDVHESVIVSILQRVMDIIDPPSLPGPTRKTIVNRDVSSKTTFHHANQVFLDHMSYFILSCFGTNPKITTGLYLSFSGRYFFTS